MSNEEAKLNGTIKWFDNKNRGYGFIEGQDGNDYFVHTTSLEKDYRPKENDQVEFELKKTDKGLSAVSVKQIKKEVNITEKTEGSLDSNYLSDKGDLDAL